MKEAAETFRDLVVWQKADRFARKVYRLTMDFPPTERYGLTSQLRCSAASIPTGIVAGLRERRDADKERFMNIVRGSLEETRRYMIMAKELRYADTNRHMDELDEIGRLFVSYRKTLKR